SFVFRRERLKSLVFTAAAVFPFQTSKAYDLGHLQCLPLLFALTFSCFPSMLTLGFWFFLVWLVLLPLLDVTNSIPKEKDNVFKPLSYNLKHLKIGVDTRRFALNCGGHLQWRVLLGVFPVVGAGVR
ncbi:hypothetical protein L9F63_007327, partial [Diploptera punctata]